MCMHSWLLLQKFEKQNLICLRLIPKTHNTIPVVPLLKCKIYECSSQHPYKTIEKIYVHMLQTSCANNILALSHGIIVISAYISLALSWTSVTKLCICCHIGKYTGKMVRI